MVILAAKDSDRVLLDGTVQLILDRLNRFAQPVSKFEKVRQGLNPAAEIMT